MEKQICKHNCFIGEQKGMDIEATCIECEELIYLNRIKEGLYTFKAKGKTYLLNSLKDIDFINSDYTFELEGEKHILTSKQNMKNKPKRLVKQKGKGFY